MNIRSYQWNCTKSCAIIRIVWTAGKCFGSSLMAAGAWLCTQGCSWRRCYCGKESSLVTMSLIHIDLLIWIPWNALLISL